MIEPLYRSRVHVRAADRQASTRASGPIATFVRVSSVATAFLLIGCSDLAVYVPHDATDDRNALLSLDAVADVTVDRASTAIDAISDRVGMDISPPHDSMVTADGFSVDTGASADAAVPDDASCPLDYEERCRGTCTMPSVTPAACGACPAVTCATGDECGFNAETRAVCCTQSSAASCTATTCATGSRCTSGYAYVGGVLTTVPFCCPPRV